VSFDILLEPEQLELLILLVEADRRLPRDQRQQFYYIQTFDGSDIQHPGLENGSISWYRGDLDALAGEGLVRVTTRSKVDTFDVTAKGFAFYRHIMERRTATEQLGAHSSSEGVATAVNGPHVIYIPVPFSHSFGQGGREPVTTENTPEQKMDDDLCFVIMSFSGEAHLEDSYEMAVKPAIEALGFRCERVDEQHFNGGIMEQVLDNIRKAQFIVADMTGARPNCYYELGMAHALKKDVVLIARQGSDVHFDIRGFNFIFYDRIGDLQSQLKRRIEGTILRGQKKTSS
jgi:hypothetical protein